MDRLGEQYEREHEKELKSTMTYMPEHFGEDVYGEGEDAAVAAAVRAATAAGNASS